MFFQEIYLNFRHQSPLLRLVLLSLVLIPPPARADKPADAQAAKPAPFEKEIEAFEAADKKSPPPQGAVLFVGDSAIRMWKTSAQDFPEYKVVNRGFGGSQLSD